MCYHRQAGFARAVKVLSKSAIDASEQERFQREIDILKMMDHPNIVRLYETYSDSKHYYLVTEYIFSAERNPRIDCARAASSSIGLQRPRRCRSGTQHT